MACVDRARAPLGREDDVRPGNDDNAGSDPRRVRVNGLAWKFAFGQERLSLGIKTTSISK